MLAAHGESRALARLKEWRRSLLWLSGLWVLPLWAACVWLLPTSASSTTVASAVACCLAPVPALLLSRRDHDRLSDEAQQAREVAEQLKLQLENVRYRTGRLREELSAADQQARLSRQLALLGQFTAGFMHEFNNPLAIVASRIEVLLDERTDDEPLCRDLQQMLQETRYMAKIGGTLLQALRRERGNDVLVPSAPGAVLEESLAALRPAADRQGVRLELNLADAPRVSVPEHVVSEVVRSILSNAFEALKGREDATVWVGLEPYRTAGATVVIRIEDNGPGVPESIRARLFEPFVSQSSGRERLGLGLFLAASLLDMYEGRLRHEDRAGGGAAFVLELPPARFSRSQPFHWFVGGAPA